LRFGRENDDLKAKHEISLQLDRRGKKNLRIIVPLVKGEYRAEGAWGPIRGKGRKGTFLQGVIVVTNLGGVTIL